MKHLSLLSFVLFLPLSFALHSMDTSLKQLYTLEDLQKFNNDKKRYYEGVTATAHFIKLTKSYDAATSNKKQHIPNYRSDISSYDPQHYPGNTIGDILVEGLWPQNNDIVWQDANEKIIIPGDLTKSLITKKLVYNPYASLLTLCAWHAALQEDLSTKNDEAQESYNTFNRQKEWADTFVPILSIFGCTGVYILWILKNSAQRVVATITCGAVLGASLIYCWGYWGPSLRKAKNNTYQTYINKSNAIMQVQQDINKHPGLLAPDGIEAFSAAALISPHTHHVITRFC